MSQGLNDLSHAANSDLGALAAKLGIVVTELTPDGGRATMPVAGNTQPFGTLHGGATAALAETLGSFAANAHARERGAVAVGIELSITHLGPATAGEITAEATTLHRGKSLASYLITVTQEGRPIASSRLTCMLRYLDGTEA